MQGRLRRAAALAGLLACCLAGARAEDLPRVTIGVVFDGSVPDEGDVLLLTQRLEYLRTIRETTRALTRRQFDVRFPDDKLAVGDWTAAGIREQAQRLLDDPEVDLILALAPMATNEVSRMGPLSKPVIGAWAIDVDAQRLPLDGDASGRPNFNYLIAPGSILRDLLKFREVVGFGSVHILTDRQLADAIPEVPESVRVAGAQLGVEVVLVKVDRSADEVLAALPPETEAVYVTPLLRMPLAESERLVAGLNRRLIPTFSLLGEVEVRRGVLAGMRTEADLPRLSRRIALNIQRVLEGEDAGDLPVLLDQPERLMINMATARSIGVYPRWRVLIEAEQLNPEALQAGPLLTIEDAVRQAVEGNAGLNAARRALDAERRKIAGARSALRPQLSLSAQALRIDEDRAAASFGSQPERSSSARVGLQQLLYADGALAGVRIARRLVDAAEHELAGRRLDVASDTAKAYIDVLRAETLERVERDNLRLTDSNLDRARRRERIGTSGPADVYRWESSQATQRATLIAADNRIAAAKIALNRLRHRPLEEPFTTRPIGLDEPWLITVGDRIRPYADDPVRFRWLRDFYVQEGLAGAVELQALDASIEAQRRVLSAARRRNRLPSLALSGGFDRTLDRGGAGAAPGPTPVDDDAWSIALVADLPLFEGGARLAETRAARETLAALELEREALVESIETRIRAAMFEAGSTFPAIELAGEAAAAARRNLELVTDAYSRGAVSIIDLLDAQTATRSAEEQAANAVFEFLLDLLEVQRASNSLDFFLSNAEREAWFERLDAFYARGGVQPRR